MSAAEQARKIRAENKQKEREEELASATLEESMDRQRAKMVGWIEEVLGSFVLSVEKKWFGGSDYWVLGNGLLSCVLNFESGMWDASDDCRNIHWEGYRITVYDGIWSGPHDKGGRGGITKKEDLEKEVAEIMSRKENW